MACGESKDAEEFGADPGYAGGLRSRCRDCRSAERGGDKAARIRENRALAKTGQKRCGSCGEIKPLDREHFVWRSRRGGYFAECRSCNRATSRARHAANPEPYRENATRWACENPVRKREIGRKARMTRRARLAAAFVEEVDPQALYERDEGVCGICEDPVEREDFDVDHIVPLARGGEHSYANTRIAHPSCNRRRGRAIADAQEVNV